MTTWTFEWEGGGFNKVQAATKKEAFEKARRLGRLGTFDLLPKLSSFVEGAAGDAIEKHWRGCFD